jgi:peptidylprolyl isomerase
VRRTAALIVLPLLLVVAACGGEEADPEPEEATLADVSVSGEPGEDPTIDFTAPIVFGETQSEVIDEGKGAGPAVAQDSTVTVDYKGVVARDGTVFTNSYEGKTPEPFPLSSVIPGFSTGLQGAHAGDRVLIGVNSADGYDPTGNGQTILAGDSLIFVVDVHEVANPVKLTTKQIPTLQLDEDGNPTGFKPTPSTPDDVEALTVEVLRKGDGPAVEAGQTLTVRYLGQVYPDGKVFDESYSKKKPVSFSLDGVIAGWQEGLEGQKVGSRVVLVIPSDKGYGPTGSGEDIPPDADLIFVVDILKAE